MISIHFGEHSVKVRAPITACETKWRIMRDRAKRGNCLRLQALRRAAWQGWHSIPTVPDRAKSIERSECTKPKPYQAMEQRRVGVWGMGRGELETRDMKVRNWLCICWNDAGRRPGKCQEISKPRMGLGVWGGGSCCGAFEHCSLDGGKWHVSEWSCDNSTANCGRSSSLHKLPLVIQHLDRYCNTASFSGNIPAFWIRHRGLIS